MNNLKVFKENSIFNKINWIVLFLIIYTQFRNVPGVLLKNKYFYIVDKLVIITLFLFLIFFRLIKYFDKKYYQKVKLLSNEIIMMIVILFFVFWGLISSTVNNNSLIVTVKGILFYLYCFLSYFVFSGLSLELNTIKKSYSALLKITLILSIIAIFQEMLFIIYPSSVDFWPNIVEEGFRTRWGIFRTPSLLGHPNQLGILCTIFILIELSLIKYNGLKSHILPVAILGSAIIFSGSRTAILTLALALFFFMHKIFLKVFYVVLLILIIAFRAKEEMNYDPYRKECFDVSLFVIKDNIFWGVGPGMFGTHVSLEYNSPVYFRYGLSIEAYDYLKEEVKSIEQQWIITLSEYGIFGFILLLIILFLPLGGVLKKFYYTNSNYVRSKIMGCGLNYFMILIYMISFTIIQDPNIYLIYFYFCGTLLRFLSEVECESSVNK